jgi:hypothetical protein
MADRVYGSVNGVKAAPLQPMLDCSTADADLQQLGAGNHPVLTCSEAGDRLVRRGAWFSPDSGVNVPLALHAERIGALRALGTRETSQEAQAQVV